MTWADPTAKTPEYDENFLDYIASTAKPMPIYASLLKKQLYRTDPASIPKSLFGSCSWANEMWEKEQRARHYEPLILLCNLHLGGSKDLPEKALWFIMLNFLPGYSNFDKNYVQDTCYFVDIGRIIKQSQSKKNTLSTKETTLIKILEGINTHKNPFQDRIGTMKTVINTLAPNLNEGLVKTSLIQYGLFPKNNFRLEVLDRTQDITPKQ